MLDIEICPTSLVLSLGHQFRLKIRANDEHMNPLVHNHPVNCPPDQFTGEITILAGQTYDSYLRLPTIPREDRRPGVGVRIPSWPQHSSTAAHERGRVHTIFADGLWTVGLEGYGQISRHPSLEEAIIADASGCGETAPTT